MRAADVRRLLIWVGRRRPAVVDVAVLGAVLLVIVSPRLWRGGVVARVLVTGGAGYLIVGAAVGLSVLGQLQWGWPGGPGGDVRRRWAALAELGRRWQCLAIVCLALSWLPLLIATERGQWQRRRSDRR